MKPIVELAECLQDSPKFRIAVEDTAEEIDQLEGKLDKLVKLCNTMVEVGKSFVLARGQFINGVWELVPLFRDDTVVMNSLNKIVQSLMEMQNFHTLLNDQAQLSVSKNLSAFMRNDLKKVKDNRKQFERISDDLDQALYRSSQVQKGKTHECEEADNNLASIRTNFRHASLDYVYEASMLQAKKRYEVLQTLLSFLKAHTTFFHQGYELCEDDKPSLSEMDSNIQKIRDETNELKLAMAGRHSLVNRKENITPGNRDVQVEGYLNKRTTNAFKTWNRRWFSIQNNQLVYRKRSKDDSLTVMEEDLRLCTVKHVDSDRRFCFEVLSPSRTHVLQADSEDTYSAWITALQVGINAAHHHREEICAERTDPRTCLRRALQAIFKVASVQEKAQCEYKKDPPSHQCIKRWYQQFLDKPRDLDLLKAVITDAIRQIDPDHLKNAVEGFATSLQECVDKAKSKGSDSDLVGRKSSYSDLAQSLQSDATANPSEEITTIAGNDMCCDCGSEQPRWASVNLGITLCIECSGIHRSLGVHHSKVKSLSLDTWEPELIGVMKELGNSFVNTIYEANVDETIAVRATPTCPRNVRESWIRAKYVQKAFTHKTGAAGQKAVRRRAGAFRRKLEGPEPRLSSAGSTISAVSSSSALSSETGTSSAVSSTEGLNLGEAQLQIRKEKVSSPNVSRTAIFFEDNPADSDTTTNSSFSQDEVKLIRKLSCKDMSPEESPPRQTVARSRSFRLKDVAKKVPRPVNGSEAPDSSSSSLSEEGESEKGSRGTTERITSDGQPLGVNSKVEPDDEPGSGCLEPEIPDPNVILHRASVVPDIKCMFAAMVSGADMNWVNEEDCGKSAIHQAIHSGSVPACEFLFLNGAKTDAKDAKGRTPLHLATKLGNTGQVCLLLKRGANRDAKDYQGQDALKIAIDFENADIVTLLRLARLNEAMKESDYGNSDDTTFSEVVRDFSQLASNNPEKLKRPK